MDYQHITPVVPDLPDNNINSASDGGGGGSRGNNSGSRSSWNRFSLCLHRQWWWHRYFCCCCCCGWCVRGNSDDYSNLRTSSSSSSSALLDAQSGPTYKKMEYTKNCGLHLDFDTLYNIIVIGDPSVGKTSLVTRLADGEFFSSVTATVGVDFRVKFLHYDDDRVVKMQLWDAAGHRRYRATLRRYYANVDAVLIVYDVSRSRSFGRVKDWAREARQHAGDDIPIFVIGNKTDLRHAVSEERSDMLCREINGVRAFHLSAKTMGDHLERAFVQIAKDLDENFIRRGDYNG